MQKIDINALRNEKGGILTYFILSFFAGFISGFIQAPTLGLINETGWQMTASGFQLAGGLLAFYAWYEFAKACKSLDSNIRKYAYIFVYCSLVVTLLSIPYILFRNIGLQVLIIIWSLLSMIAFIVLGFQLKNKYDGLLGQAGKKIVRIFYSTLIYSGFLIFFAILSGVLSTGWSWGAIKFTIVSIIIIAIIYVINILVLSFKLFVIINKLMINGYNLWINNLDDDYYNTIKETKSCNDEKVQLEWEAVAASQIVIASARSAKGVPSLEVNNYSPPSSTVATINEKVSVNDKKESALNHKRWWIIGSACLVVIIGIIIALVCRGCNSEFEGLMTEVNPPMIDPNNLSYTSELELMGWRAEDNEIEGIKLKTVYEVKVRIEFKKEFANEQQIPFKISIFDETSNGADAVYGKGVLKDGEMIAYEMIEYDEYDSGSSSTGSVIFEAKGLKNLAQFTGTVKLYSEDERSEYNFIDMLSWYKAVGYSVVSVYEGPHGRSANIHLVKPFGKNTRGVKALAFCMNLAGPESDESDETVSCGGLLTLIDSNNNLLLDCNPMPYLGVAKWGKNRLNLTYGEGKTAVMYLMNRYDGAPDGEFGEAIMEMEGGFD